MKYLLSVLKDAEKYKNKNFYKLLEAEFMTVLDKIFEEGDLRGIEKGFEKGIEKGNIKTAKNMKAEGIEL